MSRAAAGRQVAVTPKRVKISYETAQEVIETCGEGIYEFRNVSESSPDEQVRLSVRTYDNTNRGKTFGIGSRRLGEKGTVVKVMMPEGIVWSDDSAFTGNMEDAVSVTKFNALTGLVWKEYKE